MDNKLREYFPLIRTREELLAEIQSKPELNKMEFIRCQEVRPARA